MSDTDSYTKWLNRDSQESQRLDIQHELLKEALGYIVHPRIRATIGPGSRIADIGTGTGIVLAELAQELPQSCQFDGFDISDAQYPDKSTLPKNVRLHIADAKQPYPTEFHAKFDVVLVRCLNVPLSLSEWKAVASNILSILKVGGYVHWILPNLEQAARLLRRNPEVPTPAFRIIEKRLIPSVSNINLPARELQSVLEAVGFAEIIEEISSTDRKPEHRDAWTKNNMSVVATIWAKMEAAKGEHGYSTAEIQEVSKQLHVEGKTALYCRFDLHLFTARKV